MYKLPVYTDSAAPASKAHKLKVLFISATLLTGFGLSSLFSPLQAQTPPASAQIKEININNGFSSLVNAVKPAVVNIATTSRSKSSFGKTPHFGNQFFNEQFNGQQESPSTRETHALGSGFIISEDGVVVTNHHVIDGANEIEVVFQNGKRYPAILKGSDKKTDIAVLQVDADHPLPHVNFGDSDSAEVGDWVVAIGNPFGLGGSVSVGVVSARGRDIQSGPYDDFIQIDAPINRGNSGGPLFNTRGEVIGVNSAIYSPTGGSVGIGFSIPSALVENVVTQLSETGVVERGWLGVQIQTVSDEIGEGLGLTEAHGALVSQIIDKSPAQRAGIQVGDVIVSYDQQRVDEMRDLPRLVANTIAESKVALGIWRNEAIQTIEVVISENQDKAQLADANPERSETEEKLGLVLKPLTNELRKQYSVRAESEGVIITDIDPASEAAGRGVRVGDVILKVGRKNVNEVEQINNTVKSALDDKKTSLLLLIEREGQALFVAIPLV